MTFSLNGILKSLILVIALAAAWGFDFSFAEANITFQPQSSFVGNRFNGIDSVSSGASTCEAEFCDAGPDRRIECAPWDGGRAICRKEYLQSVNRVFVYGNCSFNPQSDTQYVCTRITNIPSEYTSLSTSTTIPRTVIETALGISQTEDSQTLEYEAGYTITLENQEYTGECTQIERDGNDDTYTCKAEGIDATLRACLPQTGDKRVLCRRDFVSEDVDTVGDLNSAEPSTSASQDLDSDRFEVGDSKEKPVVYESFTLFPGVEGGRISNLCQLIEALWFLGFAVLFLGVIGSILYGGFLYTSAGVNAAQVNQAKGVITNAFIGLGLGLSIFVILQTIDPNLLGGNCEIPAIDRLTNQASE